MKVAIIDTIGLTYDGNTLDKIGLGGSESAVILVSKELVKLGMEVTVFNNCNDGSHSKAGIYKRVRYIDNADAKNHHDIYDVVIVSRTVKPFMEGHTWPFIKTAGKRILWLHDTFIEGDQIMEELVVNGVIDHLFTLSDWHTSYILTADHGKKRNFEVLKKSVFQTRNGAVCHIPEVDVAKKDKNHFVYNASATKGLLPLVNDIWPTIKKHIPEAHLTIIGGYYRFREGAAPDEQEKTVRELASSEDLAKLDVTFTGVIPQKKIAEILANAYMMLYPSMFPETFGISTLESMLYRTPLVTCNFGALEETAIDLANYKIDYSVEPQFTCPAVIKDEQTQKFLRLFFDAYNNDYLHQQKQYYCDVVKDVAGWDTVALQWKQFFYEILGAFLPVDEFRKVTRINNKVSRIYGRNFRTEKKLYDSPRTTTLERKILIVSPFWNCEQYISNHILSVAAQDYDNYHHILINDRSDDNSQRVAEETIASLPKWLRHKFTLINNGENKGAVQNQLWAVNEYKEEEDDIIILLDGDDWLINNNTIFQYYNDLYAQGYEFTYGSMWSLADNIPLIAQDYPAEVKKNRSYREHHFNWKIPYTHLRTVTAAHFAVLDEAAFKTKDGKWMKSGADNPLFYGLIETVLPSRIYCNKEIIVNYNDVNPNNDYKIRGDEQNENANRSYEGVSPLAPFSTVETTPISEQVNTPVINTNVVKVQTAVKKDVLPVKNILIAIPTARYVEPETLRSLWNLDVPEGYKLHLEFFHGYQIDQIRNLIGEWAKRYDYLFSVDADIVVPPNALRNMLAANKDIVSGLYIQRIPNTHTLEVYMDTPGGGCTNVPYSMLKDRGLVEIAACGFGCALIKSVVFRNMKYPHFVYKSALNHRDTVSEDVYFCMKARDSGFKVWVDASIKCNHLGNKTFVVDDENLTRYRELGAIPMLPKAHVEYLTKLAEEIQPKVIFDIGSSVLHWAKPARELWPQAKFVLFEAIEDIGELYHENGFHDFFLGVQSDVPGKHVLFYSDPMNFGGNSYYRETTGFFDGKRSQRVTNSIDNVAALYNVPKPDLVKMDIQGAELDVLRGAVNTFVDTKDFILELQHENYNEGAPLATDVIAYMDSQGFDLVSNFTKTNVDGDYHFQKQR